MSKQDPDQIFYANVERWASYQPKAAHLLPYVETDDFSFTETDEGELNLSKKEGEETFVYHDSQGAKKEADRWFSSLELKNVAALFVYGVGLGYYYTAAKEWLKQKRDRRLVFLEDEIGVLKMLFGTRLGTQLLKDKQVQVLFFKDLSDQEEVFDNIYWDCVLSKLVVTGLEGYVKRKGESYERVSRKIAYDAAVKNALVHEYSRFGGAFFINYYQNILELPGSYLGDLFFKQYPEVPAIICGAGPSLEKNVDLLKTLQDKALIFAGGSAMNVLNSAGFQPHFGAGIDPNPAQLERLSTNQAYQVPYFYRNRMFHSAFMTIKGPRLYVTGSGGYDIAEYFEGQLGIEGEPVEEGHNVVNFCLEIACAMGCNPIIFVGMDLGFTDQKAYAPGVVEDLSMDKNRVIDEDDDDSKVLIREDVYGDPIPTLWKWIAEADWIGEFAKNHPNTTILNATEGGIGFPGVPNTTLIKASENYLRKSYDLFNRVHADIQNSAMPWITQERVENAMKELRKSLSRCVEFFNTLIGENDRILKAVQTEKKNIPQQTGLAALTETELADEPGYQHVCDVFNAVYMRMLSKKLHELRPSDRATGNWKKQEKRMILNRKRLEFLRNVAQVNAELIDYAFEQRGNLPHQE